MYELALETGDVSLVETDESPVCSAATARRIYSLREDQFFLPAIGSTWSRFGISYRLSGWNMQRKGGNRWELTVEYTVPDDALQPSQTQGAAPLKTSNEIDYVSIEQKPQCAPRFQPGGTYALTDDDFADLQAWEQLSDATEIATAFAALSSNAQRCAKLLRTGTNYETFYPVVRITDWTFNSPSAEETPGAIQTPPGDYPGGDWVYRYTACRRLRDGNGIYQRIREWTGATTWSDDLYGT
jgi:hypothetical protein